MSWLKMGRWLVVGVVGLASAAACGGRGSLPTGEVTAGEPGFAGSTSVGGTSAGGSSSGGSAFGGSIGVAGSVVGGTSGLCVPGTAQCVGNAIEFCDATGQTGVIKACGKAEACVEKGSTAFCQPQTCTPGQALCDASGTLLQVCSADGLSLVTKVNCSALGQRCQNAACRSVTCQPNQRFCDDTGVRQCNATGSASMLVQTCGPNQYCDPMSVSCKNGICSPGQPACNGSIATVCNGNGSGYLAGGVDCAFQLNRQCLLGACGCPANQADCDGIDKNGCESNIASDPDNCTGCGLACSKNHMATRTCDMACDGACQMGFSDCNMDKLKDGCETSTGSDAKNCGGCGVTCSSNHVTPSCIGSTCNGPCAASFADCNGNKQIDGCESDSRTDVKNCGGCGLACSSNHVTPSCAGSKCSGACTAGFADCNGNKQTDGCEVDTSSDAKNCGGCGKVCAAGQSCANSKCSSILTFSGVAQNLPIASLLGWKQCFVETYGQGSTSVASVQKACTGSLLMMACRPKGSTTLQLAAYAPASDVLFDTGLGNTPHNANGVGWYFNNSQSWGFAPQGDIISRNTCDVENSVLSAGGIDGDKRLCWHTTGGIIEGGWRCGKNDSLNASIDYERLLFTSP